MTPDHSAHPLDDLAVYALDALDDRERAAVDAHLETCPACRSELDQHLATLAQLNTPEAPPPELWDRIARQTTTAPDQADNVVPFDLSRDGPTLSDEASGPESSPGPRHRARGLSRPGGPERPERPERPENPERRGQEPRHRATRRQFDGTRWLVAVAAAAVIVVGVAVWSLTSTDSPETVAELAAAAADDPDATVVTLASDTGEARARVVTTPETTAYVLLDDLPRLPAGSSYQLWRIDDQSTPVSLGVLGDGTSEAAAVSVPQGSAAFALSEEPTPTGSVAPTRVVASGRA